MTVSRSSHPAVSVVVTPGPSPRPASWDLEVRGPLDPALLDHALDKRAFADQDPAVGQRLARHRPDHHSLRLTAGDHSDSAAASASSVSLATLAGRVADLLTEPTAGDLPLTPAQCAVLAHPAGQRYEAMFVEPATPLDADTAREAVRALLAAHPQLDLRADATSEQLTRDPAHKARQDPLAEGEFTDEATFSAAVALVGDTVDASLGVPLRALLARDRRPTGPRVDRLALVVDGVAVDDTSWHLLLEDLMAALTTGSDTIPARSPRVADALVEWADGLRELAGDPEEVRHWSLVAEHRARMANSRWSARVSRPGDVVGAAAADAWDWGRGGGVGRHIDFALDAGPTEELTRKLARRLALTTGQLLTGVFALALARWQRVDEVSLDVRSDPRQARPALLRHIGRLTDVHPIHLALDPGLDLLGQLAALAGPLAAGAGRAPGGAGFGACREWGPDPLLRDVLRELPSAQACLTLPGASRTVPHTRAAPAPSPHRLHARMHVVGGELHIGLDWVSDPAHGITDVSVAALGDLLRELLGELAEASTAPIPSMFRATPQQSALYAEGDARPGTGRHVEQIVWIWRGPLDAERFTAAWQSVFDRETVLRTSFTGGPEPQLLVHSHVAPDITSRYHRGDDLSPFLESDRLRGFDLRCPGALRLTLLGTGAQVSDGSVSGAPTQIVLTYHRALLDNWSVHILLREFYRAYLAGGALPGGERRPDLRDYTAWVAAQDLGPARGFWARSVPAVGGASRPGRPAGRTGLTGVGRSQLRLDTAETIRLARWAGLWGVAESSVLQAVWALLIYRASGAETPAPVRFAVTVPGRGIALDGASRMVGPLRNSLPMSVDVDPAGTVPALLWQLRDRALDLAAYEWVPGDWLLGRRGAGADSADTVVVFEDPPHPVAGLEDELTAQGIRAEFPGTMPARSVLPVGLLAHHDNSDALVLTGVHDRDVLDEEAATELLVQSALLLRELPLWARDSTTVAEVLQLLEGRAVPPMADPSATGSGTSLRTLRPVSPTRDEHVGTICLVPPPGTPASCYDPLVHAYRGAWEVVVLTGDADADASRSALVALASGPLLLGGFSGAGVPACDLARRIAADGAPAPRVVLVGATADERQPARALARALEAATARDA